MIFKTRSLTQINDNLVFLDVKISVYDKQWNKINLVYADIYWNSN